MLKDQPEVSVSRGRMFLPLWRKYVSESALLFVGLSIGVMAFCFMRVRVVGKLDTAQFQQIMDLLPKDWRKFASVDFDWLVSYLGRTSFTLDEPMLVLLITAWAIVRGSDVVSGELGRGTMEMFLAQPISRLRVFWHHALFTLSGLTVLVAIAWLGMAIGVWTTSVQEKRYPDAFGFPLTFMEPTTQEIPMSSEVDAIMFLPGIVNLFSLGFFLSALSAFTSSLDSFRWRTLGILSAFYFANAGIKILGMSMDESRWVQYLSVFGFYSPASSVELAQSRFTNTLTWMRYDAAGEFLATGPLTNNAILLGLGIVAYVAGAIIFHRRDLPAAN